MPDTLRHTLTTLALAAIAQTAIALCAPAQAATPDPVTLTLDVGPSGAEPFPYVALKEGLFAKEGLNVTIQTAHGTADVLAKLAAGDAQFGTGNIAELLTAAAQRKRTGGVLVKAILSVVNTPADALFTLDGGPINAIDDMSGHKLGVATNASSGVLWPLIAGAAGIDPASVTLLKVDPAKLGTLLTSGQADAVIGRVSAMQDIQHAMSQANKPLKVLPWTAVGLQGYELSLFASDKIIHDNPDLVTRFTRAYLAAIRLSVDDCRQAAADLHAIVATADADAAAADCHNAAPLIDNTTSQHDGLGALEGQLLHETWDWTASAHDIRSDLIDPEIVVDRKFLPPRQTAD